MWCRNALTERHNLKWPILQAPMGWLSTPALATAVSNAGGLDGLGMWGFSAEDAERRIAGFQTTERGEPQRQLSTLAGIRWPYVRASDPLTGKIAGNCARSGSGTFQEPTRSSQIASDPSMSISRPVALRGGRGFRIVPCSRPNGTPIQSPKAAAADAGDPH
jgi:hypothetical protein